MKQLNNAVAGDCSEMNYFPHSKVRKSRVFSVFEGDFVGGVEKM